MGPHFEERVERETEFFDYRQSQPTEYEAALPYLNNGIVRRRRIEILRAAVQSAAGSRVAEIGSQYAEWCLFNCGKMVFVFNITAACSNP